MKKLLIICMTLASLPSFAAEPPKLLLVIDAGHGGQDKGAVSKTGDQESELNLLFAQALQASARAHHIETVMTRDDNATNLALQERAAKSAGQPQTVFVSLHMNSTTEPTTKHGAEVIFDSHNKNAQQSAQLADKLKAALGNLTPTTIVSDKHILVLRENEAPAVLIQPGFISNPQDLQKLKSPEYQKRTAELIIQALMQ
ncbi:N-acetylmuramoyl-L-alanine amidase [Chitinophagaceae bacterium MMS25-I14]